MEKITLKTRLFLLPIKNLGILEKLYKPRIIRLFFLEGKVANNRHITNVLNKESPFIKKGILEKKFAWKSK
jgi:hypothetical protein